MAGALKILVVNADDFGLSSGINRGIESALHRGILRSASLMPNGAAFDDAVRIAQANPGLGVGIHLSLVDERCLSPIDKVRGLAGEDGSLPPSYGAFVKAYMMRRFGEKQLRCEIKNQVARVLDAGIKPTHIDSHQHLHMLPGLFDIVLETARNAGIRVMRVPMECSGPGPSALSPRGAQTRVLSMLSSWNTRRLRETGIRYADHFWGIGVSGNMVENNLQTVLNRLRDGVNEVMCHPGFADPATQSRYQWGYHWDGEAEALYSESITGLVAEKGIRLASFSNAWK